MLFDALTPETPPYNYASAAPAETRKTVGGYREIAKQILQYFGKWLPIGLERVALAACTDAFPDREDGQPLEPYVANVSALWSWTSS